MAMDVDAADLRRRWLALLPPAAGAGAAAAGEVIDELVALYAGAGRHYHGLAHIASLLALVDAEADRFADRAAVGLAVLFHDAVYDARDARGNEARSADLARDRLRRLGAPGETIDKVARFVAATAHFAAGAPPDDPDLARFLDLDLAILAAAAGDYDAYAAAIRREYAHVAEADYRAGRATALRHLLARERLYLCDDHHAAWDAAARANMRRELDRLSPPPAGA